MGGVCRNEESGRAVAYGLWSQIALGLSLSSTPPLLSKSCCLILLICNTKECQMFSACSSRSFSNSLCYQEKGLIRCFFSFSLWPCHVAWTMDGTLALIVPRLGHLHARGCSRRKVSKDGINGLPSLLASVWMVPMGISNRRPEIKRSMRAEEFLHQASSSVQCSRLAVSLSP